jgi:hypothetical protein
MILGFVKEIPAAPLGGLQGKASAQIVLIARRSVHRAGTRHWRRGSDPEVGGGHPHAHKWGVVPSKPRAWFSLGLSRNSGKHCRAPCVPL